MKSRIYGWHLGANVGFFVQNSTQSFLNVLPEIAKFTGGGRAAQVYFNAGKKTMPIVSATFSKQWDKIQDVELRGLVKRAFRDGVLADVMTQYLYGTRRRAGLPNALSQRFKTGVEEFATVFGQTSERVLRTNAFVAGVDVGKGLGLKGKDLYEFSKQMVFGTQFPFGKQNVPFLISGMKGAGRTVAELAFTYRTFRFSQFERMMAEVFGQREFVVAGHRFNRKLSGRVAQAMTPVILSGASGVMGWQMFKSISNRFGKDPDIAIRRWIDQIELPEALSMMLDNSMAEAGIHPEELKDKIGDVATRGIAGLAGIDPSRWIALGDLPISPHEDIFGIVKTMPESYMRAIGDAIKGRGFDSVVRTLPAVMRGPALMMKWRNEGGVRAADGELIYTPSQWSNILRSLNIPPLEGGKAFEKRGAERSLINFNKKRSANFHERLARAHFEKDSALIGSVRAIMRQERIPVNSQTLRRRLWEMRRGKSIRSVPKRLRREVRELRRL